MPIDRSTRTFIAAFLWVAAAFIIMNNIIGGGEADDWLLAVLFIAAGVVVYFLVDRWLRPGSWTTADDVPDTQTRSDALAAVGSPAPAELQDPVDNMLTTPTASLEETDEVASPPTAYIAAPAPEINAPTETISVPATLVTPAEPEPLAPTEPAPEPVVTANESGTESTDTQERSDAIAAVGSHAPAELQDPVDNMLTTPTATLEETDEVSGTPGQSISHSDTGTDDLTLIEGIGPKMSAALTAAGITTFAQLAEASEETLRGAISAAGMRFSPSLSTWPAQAAYAARGDMEGMRAFQQTLTSGRKSAGD